MQYEHSKSVAKRINTFADLSQLQNYDHNFMDLKLREEQTTIQVSKGNKEANNIPISWDGLTRAINCTNNSAPCPAG